MRWLPLLAAVLFFSQNVLAMGDSSALPVRPDDPVYGDSIRTLNRFRPNPDGSVIDQQEQQEKIYWEDRERENKKWEESDHDVDEYRYDEPSE